MENRVAEPEKPPLSAANSGAHRNQPPTLRHRLPSFAVCLVSGSMLLPGCLTGTTVCTYPFWCGLFVCFFPPTENLRGSTAPFSAQVYAKCPCGLAEST